MSLLDKSITKKQERPVKVLQFGEGNFLRGFVDYMIDIANEKGFFDGDIVLVKPIEFGTLTRLHNQQCQYTVSLRGIVDGKATVQNRIITSVTDAVGAYEEYEKYSEYAKLDTLRFIVSNTTEAGIVYDDSDRLDMTPPKSYPGKLTKFLYERYQHFNGAVDKGLIILPVELIDDNGIHLKECVMKLTDLWNLEEAFKDWPLGFTKIKLRGTSFKEPGQYVNDDNECGIFLDVFKMENAPASSLGQRWQYLCAKYLLCYCLLERGWSEVSGIKKLMMFAAYPVKIPFLRNFLRSQVEKWNNKDTDYLLFWTGRYRFQKSFYLKDIFAYLYHYS